MKIKKKGYSHKINKMKFFLNILLISTIAIFTTIINTSAAEDVEWEVTFNFIESSGEEDRVIFGEAPDANDGPPHDKYDIPKPPSSPPPSIRGWFYDNLSIPYNVMFKDYRKSPDSNKIWNLSVIWNSFDNSNTTITLSWSIQNKSSIEYDFMKLYVNDESVPASDILIDTSYSFICLPNEIQQFQIICQNEDLNDKTDIFENSTLFIIVALIFIIIIITFLVYWKKKR